MSGRCIVVNWLLISKWFLLYTNRSTFREQRAVITWPARSATLTSVIAAGRSTGICVSLGITLPTWACLDASTATCLRNPICAGWSEALFVVSVHKQRTQLDLFKFFWSARGCFGKITFYCIYQCFLLDSITFGNDNSLTVNFLVTTC